MFKKKPKKRWILILIVVFIIVLWNGYQRHELTYLQNIDTHSHTDSSLFDPRKWIGYSDSASHKRQYMTKDLIENHLDRNMDTIEVKNILGPPIAKTSNPQKYYYNIGYHKDLKPLFLIITWNAKGNTMKALIQEY